MSEPSHFLAYFQKIEVSLSNHQPLCVCVWGGGVRVSH
jgi:hypothetical protein